VHKRTALRPRDRRFDRRWGVKTGCEATHSTDDRANPLIKHSVRYEGTPQPVFEDIMRSLGCLTAAYTFYDLGCGKGRVLIMAETHAFARVVGAGIIRSSLCLQRGRPRVTWPGMRADTGHAERRDQCESYRPNAVG
jgi:SAM-dependent methyltransferase